MLPLVCRLNGLDNCSGYAEKPAATDSATNSFLDGPRPHRRRRHPAWRSCRHAGVLSALAEERGRVYQIGRDKAALPRGPRRSRTTPRLRSRSVAEPSERDCEASPRGRKNRSRSRGGQRGGRAGGMESRGDASDGGIHPAERATPANPPAPCGLRAAPRSGTASHATTPHATTAQPPPPIPDRLRRRGPNPAGPRGRSPARAPAGISLLRPCPHVWYHVRRCDGRGPPRPPQPRPRAASRPERETTCIHCKRSSGEIW